MNWAEISLHTTHEATDAVAALFHRLGAGGVVIEDPALVDWYRHSGQWDICAIPEADDPEAVVVKAYLPADAGLKEKLMMLSDGFSRLGDHGINGGAGTVVTREVCEEDWASSWKKHFHPFRVGRRLAVKPSWEDYQAAADETVIDIDPGMAFGTGTHATTKMVMEFLEDALLPGATVFDVGAGSGILAIAAAKLGASKVLAVDNDPVAVRITAENAARNGVDATVTVAQGDLLAGIDGCADLVTANIIADVIIRLAPGAYRHLRPGGALIAGGVIAERLVDVTGALEDAGFSVERVAEEGVWVALFARRGGE